ncbi:hypothetical protein NDU88_006907 [Pleurodeles waltl]|uniref:Uncharacterized protein n=1 Tax=Pleurodeles waltl TaxID=8319 RepID=A0AAV7UMW8_PLEWA|nr:hypothetical protein NDU88_006907 [Pleurodeles waltl]
MDVTQLPNRAVMLGRTEQLLQSPDSAARRAAAQQAGLMGSVLRQRLGCTRRHMSSGAKPQPDPLFTPQLCHPLWQSQPQNECAKSKGHFQLAEWAIGRHDG